MPRVPHGGLDEAKLPARVGFGSKTNPSSKHGMVVVESVGPRGVAKGKSVLALPWEVRRVAPGSGHLNPVAAGNGIVGVPGSEVAQLELDSGNRRLGLRF